MILFLSSALTFAAPSGVYVTASQRFGEVGITTYDLDFLGYKDEGSLAFACIGCGAASLKLSAGGEKIRGAAEIEGYRYSDDNWGAGDGRHYGWSTVSVGADLVADEGVTISAMVGSRGPSVDYEENTIDGFSILTIGAGLTVLDDGRNIFAVGPSLAFSHYSLGDFYDEHTTMLSVKLSISRRLGE
jgi:hypothetical protein